MSKLNRKRGLRGVMIGAGDVALRLAAHTMNPLPPLQRQVVRWYGLARSEARATVLRQAAILPVAGDLDQRRSLRRIAALARASSLCAYLAPPPGEGLDDTRLKHWQAAVASPVARRRRPEGRKRPPACRRPRPLRAVYVSTTGVYGDCAGELINEMQPLRPHNVRAKRRVAAEQRFRQYWQNRGAILRAPGIYAADRLPVERLKAGTPALIPADDVYSNHIHADDLAYTVWLAAFRSRPGRVVNVVDDAQLKMGDYFDLVADRLGLRRPPRLARPLLINAVSPQLYSFMSESRRIDNRRLKQELRVRLRYATPADFLKKLKPQAALQRSLI